ncbi:hypothetical protein [Catellatospora sp. NPDC049609]|uniref:hypothetical protein n=1 Tax=Catellatospora sp. NPDC049609 TaxID=3155505 RepID=UPI0034434235
MSRLARVLAAAVTALAVATAAAPAHAGQNPVLYKWLSCPAGTGTTGQLDITNINPVPANGTYLTAVSGGMALCRKVTATYNVFATVQYTSTSSHGSLHSLPLNATTYTFNGYLDIAAGVEALCLLATDTERLACVSIVWTTVDGVARPTDGGPLPVDAPLVDRPVVINMYGDDPTGPGCLGCD